jgi:hypothetical protein
MPLSLSYNDELRGGRSVPDPLERLVSHIAVLALVSSVVYLGFGFL